MKRLILGLFLCTTHFGFVGKTFAQILPQQISGDEQSQNERPPNSLNRADSISTLKQIQELRKKGNLIEAKVLADNYLNANPDDADIRLLLGLMQSQNQQYVQAENNLALVLKKYPSYLEARIGLIQIKINEKKYTEAKRLIQQGLILDAHNNDLASLEKRVTYLEDKSQAQPTPISISHRPQIQAHLKSAPIQKLKPKKTPKHPVKPHDLYLEQAKQYESEGKYQQQYFLLASAVKHNPQATEYRLALANYYLAHHNELSALKIISDGLRQTPNNTALLVKKAEIQMNLYEYPQASLTLHQILINDSQEKKAKVYLDEIADINPPYNYGVNEIGLFTSNAYVADLHSVWDYSTLYYSRDIDTGRIGGRVNYASRQGLAAPQFAFDYAPRLSANLYLDLSAAVSDEPALFPDRMLRGEAYFKVAKAWEVSAGGQYSKIASTYFSTYTSSINLYKGNYWLSFRPYYFVPKSGVTSLLYTGTIRRYFATIDHFIGLGFGSGTSPDIADLLTVNFIVIKNSFINVNYEFPILNHRFVLDVGAGYQRWKYPSTLNRNLYDAKLGIKYRF
jgi:YaiO family outer membrane protein